MTGPSALSVRGLSVRYGSATVVSGVDLEVPPGEVVALLGRNGSGKSTVLRAVAGLIRPAAGSVAVAGLDVTGRPAHEVARCGVGLVPERGGTFSGLTVLEHLRLASLRAAPGAGERIAEALEDFPVLSVAGARPARALSGGERRMLALAAAFVRGPGVMLLDEPSLGLAPRAAAALDRAVARLTERGIAIVVVEQHVRLALALAGRAYLLRRGRTVLEAPAAELLADPRLVEAYLGAPDPALAAAAPRG
ncbi:MAG: ATP-binding cassette domain-containing protein [Actinobacteria bacterium]|nr:ATP-binding cassette domain-containing protein [Actinomycetota bacterium]